MRNRGYKQLYLRRKQTNNPIFMQNLTPQRHSKKVLHTVIYCMSKESVQQTANSSAIAGFDNDHKIAVRHHVRVPKL